MPILMKGRSQGFTLVEMSIVLVIIGLIIGGILKGQEVIASARQKAVINQVNAVKSATNTYFDRYRALPGDDPNTARIDATNLAAGNGNGYVGTTAADTAAEIGSDVGNGGENYMFFNALVATNLLNGAQVTVSTATPGTTFGNTALPAAPITGAGMTVLYGAFPSGGNGSTARRTHWIRLHKDAQTPVASVSPRTAANIDTQIDDGVAGNGGVRGNSGNCDDGVNYTASDNIGCIPLFEVTQ